MWKLWNDLLTLQYNINNYMVTTNNTGEIMKDNLSEIFTPTRPANLTYVERDKESEQLIRALKTPGKQIIVYGNSGSGKTT